MNILRAGLQSAKGGFQEGPLKDRTLKHTLKHTEVIKAGKKLKTKTKI